MKILTFVLILMVSLNTPGLQANDLDSKIIEARETLLQGNYTWDESKLQNGLSQFQRLLTLGQKEWLLQFYVGYAEYRLSLLYLSQNNKDKSETYLEDAIEHFKLSQAKNDTFPESYAMMASCFGNMIGLKPWKSVLLGPRSNAALDKASDLGPENPRVWMTKGVNSFYTPKMFGGGKEKAEDELRKAIEFFKTDSIPEPIYPNWGLDEAWAWLGQILQGNNKLDEARACYEKGLEVNPENGWIRYQLLPKLDKMTKEE